MTLGENEFDTPDPDLKGIVHGTGTGGVHRAVLSFQYTHILIFIVMVVKSTAYLIQNHLGPR